MDLLVTHATDLLLIVLHSAAALMETDVGQGADQAVGPVEVFGRYASLRVGIVLGMVSTLAYSGTSALNELEPNAIHCTAR